MAEVKQAKVKRLFSVKKYMEYYSLNWDNQKDLIYDRVRDGRLTAYYIDDEKQVYLDPEEEPNIRQYDEDPKREN